ncbi:hypothetical protein EPN96_03800 [bacterium]|nr:MAG: hypothetical protein EPN96_03800 [bacterium]
MDSVLSSIEKFLVCRPLKISVVWHADGPHVEGYQELIKTWKAKGVNFYERSGRAGLGFQLARIFIPKTRNFKTFFKRSHIRKADNFQPLLLEILKSDESEFLSFNTDDCVFIGEEAFPERAMNHIRKTPDNASYRMFLGSNLDDCPKDIGTSDGLMFWNYFKDRSEYSWTYPFAIDGTFYDRKSLVKLIDKILVHNPITLEMYLSKYCKKLKLYGNGSSPVISKMTMVPLNKVSHIVPTNRHGCTDVLQLNKYYLDGYRLELNIPYSLNKIVYLPDSVTIARGDDRISLSVVA